MCILAGEIVMIMISVPDDYDYDFGSDCNNADL